MSQAEEMNQLDEEEFDSRKARVLLAKLNRTIDSPNLYRSLSEFATTIHPTLIMAENSHNGRTERIDEDRTRRTTKEPPQPANLPRNLEIKIPSCVFPRGSWPLIRDHIENIVEKKKIGTALPYLTGL